MNTRTQSVQHRLLPYYLLTPAFAVLALIILYPLLSNAIMSLQTVRLLKGTAWEFIGVAHYQKLLGSRTFRGSVLSSIVFVCVSMPLAFIPSLALALILNEVRKFRSVITAGLLVPWAISPVVTGYIWRWLFHDSFGMINHFLLQFRLIQQPVVWLAQPAAAVFAVCVANAWRFMPYMAIMLLAGLHGISRDLYEAAEVDGANAIQRFWHVTLSQLRHVVTVVVLFSLIWMVNDFALIYLMTEGGPANATQVLPIAIYRIAFEQLRLGRGAAASMILLVFLLCSSFLFIRVFFQGDRNGET
ncbi:MAG: sugar ABC transporter permease [bacterium]